MILVLRKVLSRSKHFDCFVTKNRVKVSNSMQNDEKMLGRLCTVFSCFSRFYLRMAWCFSSSQQQQEKILDFLFELVSSAWISVIMKKCEGCYKVAILSFLIRELEWILYTLWKKHIYLNDMLSVEKVFWDGFRKNRKYRNSYRTRRF